MKVIRDICRRQMCQYKVKVSKKSSFVLIYGNRSKKGHFFRSKVCIYILVKVAASVKAVYQRSLILPQH